ncbi:MAG: carbohydrate ABC transporter permease [Glycomyces artemisiae]|uniref:Carbohydrate ABC transporter membrane protein 2 (CUT1 family) n=1 Tax=Glycomyces artemisiae TaxID=1076443 RepID=A0A2T0UX76_9ACTN|nr:carbohydrate ABC transporter permease [Glycomyces artemisiae]NUQ90173.1 carbohydrate ABC transporter permease [Glycomyces artemisiae]PRY62530.1 carbohydrate ABC transporter membrane protein 2 (CUT1 family) [Glycomyces artemisiae]
MTAAALRPRSKSPDRRARRIGTIIAAVLALAWTLPILWVLVGSFNAERITSGSGFLPSDPTGENWTKLVQPDGRAVNVFVAFFNSTVVAVAATVLALVVCSMMAYALARLPFRGSAVVLAAIVLMMLVPTEVILVPLFQQFAALGLLNTYGALIIPHVVSLFGVVLLRQFIANLPVELTEAAKIDGANAWQNYRYIVLPLIRPGLATLGILVFLAAWNDFLWPLIATSTPSMQTLPLALITFRSAYGDSEYGVVMASTILAITPPLLIFLLAQRFIVQGISNTGLKG